MSSAKPGRKEASSRTVTGKFKKVGPLISSGMMKKLEPVLRFQRRTMHCRPSLTTIKPLNATQDLSQSHSKKGKEQDVYCFSSSPKERSNETSASKGERGKEKKAAMKARKVLERYANKEVLATIRNTREYIQLLRRQLQVNKNWANQQRF